MEALNPVMYEVPRSQVMERAELWSSTERVIRKSHALRLSLEWWKIVPVLSLKVLRQGLHMYLWQPRYLHHPITLLEPRMGQTTPSGHRAERRRAAHASSLERAARIHGTIMPH